jgi:hypothetical protein
MAPNTPQELRKFIAAAREHGQAMKRLPQSWKTPGSSKAETCGAPGERYESLCGVPVPAGKKTTTPAKDAFLYLQSFLTLATWTISLGSNLLLID